MSTLIPAGVLHDMRMVVNDSLPDSVTIARTGVSTNCRVSEMAGDYRMTGMPAIMRFKKWKILMPYLVGGSALDVKAGDTLTVATMGTYIVMEMGDPRSYSTSTEAFCLQIYLSDGTTLPMLTNQTITFRRLQQDGTYVSSASVGVFIEPVSQDEYELGDFSRIEWQVFYPSSVTIGGLPVGPDDQIVWSGLRIPEGFATLKRPIARPGPLPYSTARFSEPA